MIGQPLLMRLLRCNYFCRNNPACLCTEARLGILHFLTLCIASVLNGCETWLLTLREEGRPWGFENRVQRRIFWPKRDEVTGEWKRLHNKELYALYSSPHIIRVIRSRKLKWAGHAARMGERTGVYRVLMGKLEARRPLGRPRRGWGG